MNKHNFSWIRRDCLGCGKPLLPEQHGLCPGCLPIFEEEYGACRHYLTVNSDSIRLPVLCLTHYSSRENTLSRRMILEKKGNNLRDLDEFLAQRLAGELNRYFPPEATEDVVVWVPRSGRGIARTGIDHVRGLAIALGKECAIPVSDILCRRKRWESTDQKELDGPMREANARNAFTVRTERLTDIAGKRCLLLDDICTSGATLSACTELLLQYGAADVLGLCICAADNRQKTNINNTITTEE